MIDLITTIWPAAIALGAAALYFLGRVAGARKERDKRASEDLERYKRTRKDVEKAIEESRNDGSDWRDRLRNRHKR